MIKDIATIGLGWGTMTIGTGLFFMGIFALSPVLLAVALVFEGTGFSVLYTFEQSSTYTRKY